MSTSAAQCLPVHRRKAALVEQLRDQRPAQPPAKRRRPARPLDASFSSSSSTSMSSAAAVAETATGSSANAAAPVRQQAVAGLPDEVLVRVLGFVACAPTLATLRMVSTSWRAVIDSSPSLWADASFKRTFFAPPVVELPMHQLPGRSATSNASSCSSTVVSAASSRSSDFGDEDDGDGTGPDHTKYAMKRSSIAAQLPSTALCVDGDASLRQSRLALGPRPGYSQLCRAAAAGNEWAAFLRETLFEQCKLRALTLSAELATALVCGGVAALRPPANVLCTSSVSAACLTFMADGRSAPQAAPCAPGWIAVHAARARGRGGALLGIVFVQKRSESDMKWRVTRAVSLERPIWCAGYVGLWTMTDYLTELLIRALHTQ
jgi:F-box-like